MLQVFVELDVQRNPMLCYCHIRERGGYLSEAGKPLGSTCLICCKACIQNIFCISEFKLNPTNCFLCTTRADWSKEGVDERIIFPIHCFCKGTWIHTFVPEQLCYLVLGGSRDPVEWAQLGQSLHKVTVVSIQSAYSDSCHCKVLETRRHKWKRTVKANTHWRKAEILLRCQRGYKKSHSLSVCQSSAEYIPCSSPTSHVSSVDRAN